MYLKKVPDVSVCSFGIRTRNLKQGALLAYYKNVCKLSNKVAVSCSENQEICLRHLVQVNWSSEKVVFKCLKKDRL